MLCPKCHSPMEAIVFNDVETDRCTRCKARKLDTGEDDQGEHTNAIDRYACPRCGGGMVRMVDVRQSHIWYEQCSACGGSFFDAGEFRDLAESTISDFFRNLATPARG